MSRALSIDLRIRVVAAVDSGASHREAAERFGMSAASGSRWRYLQLQQGNVRPGRWAATAIHTKQKLILIRL